MNRILAAVSVLKAEPEADPIAQLFDVAKKFKPLTPPAEMRPDDDHVEFTSDEPWEIALDECEVDPTHQRPMDRDKVEAMRRDRTWEREPILVNFTPDESGTYYILDGQHRAEAARQAGETHIKATVKIIPTQDEHEHIGVMAKVAKTDSRIPAGDPRRGRIHPGEWTKENNPATLAKAEEKAHSLPERAVIHHRMKQLRSKVAVPGLLSPETEKQMRAELARTERELSPEAVKRDLAALADDHRRRAQEFVVGYQHENDVRHEWAERQPRARKARAAAHKLDLKEAQAKSDYLKAHREYQEYVESLRQKYGLSYWEDPQAKANKTEVKKHDKLVTAVNEAQRKHNDAAAQSRAAHSNLYAVVRDLAMNDVPESVIKRSYAPHRAAINARFRQLQKERKELHVGTLKRERDEYKSKLALHEKAKGEATARARAVKKEKVTFTKQVLGQAFSAELKKHPGHIRAIFLDDTPAHDGILYAEYDAKRRLTTAKRAKWTSGNVQIANRAASDKLPKGLDLDEKQAALEELKGAVAHLSDVGLTPAGSKPTKAEIQAWVTENCPNLIEHGKAKGAVSALVNHLYQSRPTAQNVKEYRRGRADFHAFAEIGTKHEQQVTDALYGIGAKAEDHEVPELINLTYGSWADRKMDNGKRLAVDLRGGKRITYVPHKTLVTGEKDTIVHTATLKLSPQKVKALHAAIEKAYNTRARNQKDLVVVAEGWREGMVGLANLMPTHYGPTRKPTAAELKKAGWIKVGTKWLAPEDRNRMEREKTVVNELAKRRKPLTVEFESTHHTMASKEADMKVREFKANSTYTWDPAKGEYVHHPAKGQSAPAPKTQAAAANYQRFTKALDEHLKKAGISKEAKEVLRQNYGPLHEAWMHASEAVEGKEVVEDHKAPRSERGMLRFQGFKPAEAVKMMEKLGLASGMTESVPYDLIYGDRGHRRGRVTPMHRDYATGEHPIPVPPRGQMALHGVTGRGRGGLVQIIDKFAKTGGPKAISERRRQGIVASGLSIKGDMGSGIDQYLFTRIGTQQSYGGGIVLGLRHTALARRDVLLSPTDYGPGSDRHGRYAGHMKRIGAKIHGDVPHDARVNQLQTSLGARNEWNLKHEVPWEEIHTIFVDGSKEQFQAVQRRVKMWQRKGAIPKHVKVAQNTPENVERASHEAAMEL